MGAESSKGREGGEGIDSKQALKKTGFSLKRFTKRKRAAEGEQASAEGGQNQLEAEEAAEKGTETADGKQETTAAEVQTTAEVSPEQLPETEEPHAQPEAEQAAEEPPQQTEDPSQQTEEPSQLASVPVEEQQATACAAEDGDYVEAVVAKVSEFGKNEMREVDIGNFKALLVRQDGEFSALRPNCTHCGAPLVKGNLGNGRVQCPKHDAWFSIRMGDSEEFPGLHGIPGFEVRVEGEDIIIIAEKKALETAKQTGKMCVRDVLTKLQQMQRKFPDRRLEKPEKCKTFLANDTMTVKPSNWQPTNSITMGSIRTSCNTMDKAIQLVMKATDADREENYEEALQLYQHAIVYFLHVLKYEVHGERAKESVHAKCIGYMERVEQLKKFLDKKSRKVHSHGSTAAKERKKLDGKVKWRKESLLAGTIAGEKPNVHWDDIAGLTVAKAVLEVTVIIPVKFPYLFTGKRQPWREILLYGPPGTGKSYLAKAVATETKSTFFSVSSVDLVSMYLDESEWLVQNLFEKARANRPAVIFIDELDSLCSYRSDSENDAIRCIRTEFFVQMQQFGVDNDGIFVLGASNIPWRLDTTIRRQFKKRIYIPLPDEAARRRMFEIQIGNTATDCKPEDMDLLAARTDGYSGAVIEIVVREALMISLRKVQNATHFKYVRGPTSNDPDTIVDDLLTPCGPRDRNAIEMNYTKVESDKLKEPNMTTNDFLCSLEITKPTVNADDLKKFEQFTADFGQEG